MLLCVLTVGADVLKMHCGRGGNEGGHGDKADGILTCGLIGTEWWVGESTDHGEGDDIVDLFSNASNRSAKSCATHTCSSRSRSRESFRSIMSKLLDVPGVSDVLIISATPVPSKFSGRLEGVYVSSL